MAKKGLQKYLIQLQQHPLRTKAITAAVLSAISDIVSQKITGIKRLQMRRLLLKVLFGFAYLGPFGHFLHLLLDKLFKGKKDTTTVAKKVVLEQVTSSPWNNLLFMIYYGLVIESRPWIQVKSNIKKEYPKVQYTSWTFWPVVSWINHQYVPLQFRVIFASIVACGWGIFLNLRARSMALKKAWKSRKLRIWHGNIIICCSKIIGACFFKLRPTYTRCCTLLGFSQLLVAYVVVGISHVPTSGLLFSMYPSVLSFVVFYLSFFGGVFIFLNIRTPFNKKIWCLEHHFSWWLAYYNYKAYYKE